MLATKIRFYNRNKKKIGISLTNMYEAYYTASRKYR